MVQVPVASATDNVEGLYIRCQVWKGRKVVRRGCNRDLRGFRSGNAAQSPSTDTGARPEEW